MRRIHPSIQPATTGTYLKKYIRFYVRAGTVMIPVFMTIFTWLSSAGIPHGSGGGPFLPDQRLTPGGNTSSPGSLSYSRDGRHLLCQFMVCKSTLCQHIRKLQEAVAGNGRGVVTYPKNIPMRRSPLILGFLLLLAIPSFSQSKDESIIRQMLADQTAAWNRGSLDDFMKGYWKQRLPALIGQSGSPMVIPLPSAITRSITTRPIRWGNCSLPSSSWKGSPLIIISSSANGC